MKLFFLLLVLANVALFAWQHGAFGRYAEPGREPERIARQIEPERIRVLSERDVHALRERASQAKAAAAASAPAAPDLNQPQACIEFGDFLGADVARVETALLGLGLGSRQVARPVEVPGFYMVYVPPYKTRAEADRAAADVQRRGLKDVVVLTDGPQRFGISLGLFREPDLAKAHLASVEKLGVKNVRLSDKPTSLSGTRYQLRELDATTARQLGEIRKEFPAQSIRPCGTG